MKRGRREKDRVDNGNPHRRFWLKSNQQNTQGSQGGRVKETKLIIFPDNFPTKTLDSR